MKLRSAVPGAKAWDRGSGFPSRPGLLLVAIAMLLTTGCFGTAPAPIPPLSPELVAARFGMGTVRSFAFSGDGGWLAAGGDVGRLYLVNVRKNQIVSVVERWSAITGVHVIGDAVVASSVDGQIVRYGIQASGLGAAAATLATGSPVRSLAVDARGSWAAAGGENGQIVLWDMKSQSVQASRKDAHKGAVRGVAFSPDGKTLYSGGDDGLVRSYAVPTLADARISGPQNSPVLCLTTLGDGRTAAGCQDGGVRILDGTSLSISTTYRDLNGPIYCVASFGTALAAGSSDQRLGVWQLAGEKPVQLVQNVPGKNQTGIVYSCAFGSGGTTLAAGGEDKLVLVHDLQKAEEAPHEIGHPSSLLSVAFSPDDKFIATGGSGPAVQIWETESRSLARVIPLKGVLGDVLSVIWSPTGRIASGSEDGSVCLVDPDTGNVIRGEYPSDGQVPQQVNEVDLSPDGKLLASAGWDRKIHLWKVGPSSLEHMGELKGHTNGVSGIAFSADGEFLGSSSWDQSARYWNVAEMKEQMKFGGMAGPIFSVAVAPDRNLLVAGGWHGQTWAWNVETGANEYRKDVQTDVVYRTVFSPDGKWVASGSADRTVRVFDVDNQMQPVEPPLGGFRGSVRGISWSKDAGRVAIATNDGNLFVQPARTAPQPASSASPSAPIASPPASAPSISPTSAAPPASAPSISPTSPAPPASAPSISPTSAAPPGRTPPRPSPR